MAPNHSKLVDKSKSSTRKRLSDLFESPMRKVARGSAVFSDDFVEAMAEGKKVPLPKKLDDIVVDVDEDEDKENKGIDWNEVLKPVPQSVIDEDEDVKTYSEAMMKAKCPKYERNIFAVFDNADFYSDGEVKKFNLKCLGNKSSPCSHCSGNNNNVWTPDPSPSPPEVKKSEFAQAKGFYKEDYEGEEDTPKKLSANACKWCLRDPCVIDDEEVREEGRIVVDNLNANNITEMKPYRFALYRMYACFLGYIGKRYILPCCVYLYVEKHFVEPGEECTGFKPK